jgi:hypothetical protein
MMKTALRFTLLLCFAAVPAAGSLLYDVTSVDSSHHPYEFSFTEPDFLSTTTTISTPALNIITQATSCTITSATFSDPLSALPSEGDCTGVTILTGPFNHVGTFTNGATLPTILTISGTVTSTVPEPSLSYLLLPLAAVLIAKKRVVHAPKMRA